MEWEEVGRKGVLSTIHAIWHIILCYICTGFSCECTHNVTRGLVYTMALSKTGDIYSPVLEKGLGQDQVGIVSIAIQCQTG